MDDQKNMFQDIVSYVETHSDVKPVEQFATDIWKQSVEELFEDVDDTSILGIKDMLIEIIPSFYEAVTEKRIEKEFSKRKTRLEEFGNIAQIEQRSDEWYKHAQEFLTASQFGDLLGAKRTRGKLVMSKVKKDEDETQQNRRNAVWLNETNPFDWGIRFEPVAKMIYEHITGGTHVLEVGRIVHPEAKYKLAASPDGIIDYDPSGKRLGCLVEFKAPISRVIESGVVPKNYWHQMQIQMEVTDVDRCDYFEVNLRSQAKTSMGALTEGPTKYFGYVYSIGKIQHPYVEPQPYRYAYSKLNEPTPDTTTIDLQEGDTLLEIIPWELLGYNLVPVHRSHTWFNSIVPSLAQFWEDVEQARQGVFIVPEGRKMRAKSACLIQDDIEPKSSTKRNYNFMVIENNIDDHNDKEPILSVDA